jgi:multidrug efflux pump subunit AcrB
VTTPIDRDTRLFKMAQRPLGPAGRVAQVFINSKLTPLLIIAALILGVFAVLVTPREEEPQILVPMIDVIVPYPGATAAEVEQRVATPLERLVWEVPGVEYVYTTSSPNFAMAIVRFKVGHDPESALVKLYTKLMAHPEALPAGAGPAVVKPKSIDDVPIVSLTLWSERYNGFQLRKAADELALEIKKIPNISEVNVIGGERREIRVALDPDRLRGYNASALQIAQALQQVNWNLPVGSLTENNREVTLAQVTSCAPWTT